MLRKQIREALKKTKIDTLDALIDAITTGCFFTGTGLKVLSMELAPPKNRK